MRIERFDLRAYGPFTDVSLDLSAGEHGLHLVHGPNEAGKSSALRALRAWLYGMGHYVADAWVHDYPKLLVGGELRGADGQTLTCYRRKRRKDPLVDADDEPLDEAVLTRLLGGVSEGLFGQQFGLSHDSLVSGGDALLADRGAEASALFGSGLGGTSAHHVQQALADEAGEIYRSNARNPALNDALARLKEVQGQLRNATLSVRAWEQARDALGVAAAERETTRAALEAAQARRELLRRVQRTAPRLARRTEAEADLEALGPLPTLPEDAARRHREAVDGRARHARTLAAAEEQRQTAVQALEALPDNGALLEAAGGIDDLVANRLGAVRQAETDSEEVGAAVARDRARLEALQHRWGWSDDPARVQQVLEARRELNRLAQDGVRLDGAVQEARRQATAAQRRLEREREALAGLAPAGEEAALQAAVAAARHAATLDEQVATLVAEVAEADAAAAEALARLGRWSAEVDALAGAALPDATVLRAALDSHRQQADAAATLDAEADQLATRRDEVGAGLAALQRQGEVPSASGMAAAREARDAAWAGLRARWEAGEPADPGSLDAFAAALASADDLADALRLEADRVQQQADLLRQQDALAQAGERLAARRRVQAEAAAQAADAFAALWSGLPVTPGTPAEMLAWREQAEQLRSRWAGRNSAARNLARLRQERTGLAGRLATALGEPAQAVKDASLAPLLARAEEALQAHASRATRASQCADLAADLQTAQDRAAEAEAAHAAWTTGWAARVTPLGLPAEASVDTAENLLDAADETSRLQEKVAGGERRLRGMTREREDFAADVAQLVQRLAPDLDGQAATLALRALQQRVRDAEQVEARREALDQRVQAAQDTADAARRAQADADALLADLAARAGCAVDDLPAALDRQQQAAALRARLAQHDEALADEPGTVESLAAEVAGLAQGDANVVDRAAAELEALDQQLAADLQPAFEAAVEAHTDAQREFAAMHGDDDAARLAEQVEELAAEARELARRCAVLRIARRVLLDAVERFRAEHRDPLLAGASATFARLTGGEWGGVDTRWGDDDQRHLQAVRASGERLDMAALSTGTRDQLYLALRLAALEHYCARAEPLPFVLDDILVQFDDVRTAACLEVLADFSAHTQVVLFTHHRQVVQQARLLPGAEGRVFLHPLGDGLAEIPD